jgi:hypothetical protein
MAHFMPDHPFPPDQRQEDFARPSDLGIGAGEVLSLALDYQLLRRHVNNDRIRVLLVDERTAVVVGWRQPHILGANGGRGKDNKRSYEDRPNKFHDMYFLGQLPHCQGSLKNYADTLVPIRIIHHIEKARPKSEPHLISTA